MRGLRGCHSSCGARLVILLLALAAMAAPAFADAPTTGLAAWYPFPGNPADYSGNDHHGTVNGAVLAADRFANPEEAYSFDGTNDYIAIADSSAFDFSGKPFTLSAWINVSGAFSGSLEFGSIFDRMQPGTGNGYRLDYSTFDGTFRLLGSTSLTVTLAAPLTVGVWYHVAAVSDGAGSAKIYLDSAEKVSGGYVTIAYAVPPRIGDCQTTGTAPFKGRIDEVWIYDRALTPAEVQDLYAEAEPAPTYDVTVSGAPSDHGAWSGTNPDIWAPSGTGANVAISEIQSRLNAGTGVTVLTHVGGGTESGDIVIKNALSWSAGALTLQAARNIHIDAVLTGTGSSALAMTAASGAVKAGFAPGECNGFAGRVDFPGRSGTGFLAVNGVGYTVINALGEAGSTTGTDLQGISGALGGKYALGADIDASVTSTWNHNGTFYEGFLPLGDLTAKFTGAFDGLGHTVSGLRINRPGTEYAGLFGYAQAAELRNVGLQGGDIAAFRNLGGLVGQAASSVLNNVYVVSVGVRSIPPPGTAEGVLLGGLVGTLSGGSIRDAYSNATVRGEAQAIYIMKAGGLAGNNTGFISDAYTLGGYLQDAGDSTGGLVGSNFGTIANCYTSGGRVRLTKDANAFLTKNGGLVGWNNTGTIINSYSIGKALWNDSMRTPPEPMGGLVGRNSGTITDSYATTDPAYTADVYGLVGSNTGTVTDSFWDTEASGVTVSAAGTGLTTAAMMDLDSFGAIWDIDATAGTGKVWRIYDTRTYPLLRSYLAPLTATANDHARQYTGVGYSGGNGVSISPAGYDASKVFGNPASLTYSGDSQGAVDPGTYAIVPAGLWSGQPGYDIGYAPGTLTIVPGVVGRVPDGGSGTPLAISRNLTQLHLEWGASCGTLATDFAVYEGALGDWDSHSSLVCSTGGAPSATVTPSSDDRYYLIVPLSATHEGSYGTTSGGTEIPASLSPCRATQDLSGCP